MKQKHLAVALSAIFAAAALTGCGSDSDSNYGPGDTNPPVVEPELPGDGETPDGETPDGENPDGETPDVPGVDNDNPIDNPGDAAEDGDRAEKSSVVGQQYVRGNESNFDRTASTNGVAGNDGNNTVVGFQSLQNKAMTNIVVAQFPDASNVTNGVANNVKYILGAEPNANPSVTDNNSIQQNNDSNLGDGTGGLSALVQVQQTSQGSAAPEYQVTGQESFVNGVNNRVTQTETTVNDVSPTTDANGNVINAGLGNDVRVFGKLANTNDETAEGYFNSAQYRTKNAAGNDIALTRTDLATPEADRAETAFGNTNLTLNHVQYGRVTGDLDNLRQEDLAGQSYVQADFVNKDFNSTKAENDSDATDVYFYRGVGETTLAQMANLNEGTYQYAGHALMYGIDNSYSGGPSDGGNSNAPAFGVSGNAVGNFVQAEYNSGTQKVTGSIYNVWDKGADNGALEAVDLVKFDGNVVGNSVNGGAQLQYGDINDGKGSFKGSFFGDMAQELGGALNSIDSETGYGNSKWGGVFGAKKIEGTTPPPVGVPPINGVE